MFRVLEARGTDVFWLDAGADATEGWSFVGTGERSSLPRGVALDVARSDPTLPPFSGGWVGWLDYESGAAAAGVAVSGTVDATDGSWLRATRIAAFDHAARRVWVLGTESDLPAWVAELTAV
ncbi:MAG: anthranilate synthase component family protein, partial [Microbacterium sp.]|nr:anthranilate synthase component family protein [Microbacterium sp.]